MAFEIQAGFFSNQPRLLRSLLCNAVDRARTASSLHEFEYGLGKVVRRFAISRQEGVTLGAIHRGDAIICSEGYLAKARPCARPSPVLAFISAIMLESMPCKVRDELLARYERPVAEFSEAVEALTAADDAQEPSHAAKERTAATHFAAEQTRLDFQDHVEAHKCAYEVTEEPNVPA